MQLITGTVIQGKVVLDGVSLPEGAQVAVLAQDPDSVVHLSDALRIELEEALAEADREEGISGDALLERLRRYG